MSRDAATRKRGAESATFPRVVRDKHIMHGQPVIKGTRIPVAVIFDYLADGYSVKDVLERFPHLSPDDVQEALRYGSSLLGTIGPPRALSHR